MKHMLPLGFALVGCYCFHRGWNTTGCFYAVAAIFLGIVTAEP